ncbi:permease [Halobacillus hunanensis]|uniref:permease n=1 Tax=Halobacillus hunanensis TaxID=578214 RepID=UPI0009A64737|nr:permease [Halobacillus hunanensis]
MDYHPRAFFVLGTLLGLMGAFFLTVGILASGSPPVQTYTVLSLAVLAYSMSYLYPQFKQKDERMKLIRQKGMFYSFFAMMFYFIVILSILQFNIISLTAIELLNILIALNISTVFLSWVILARKY